MNHPCRIVFIEHDAKAIAQRQLAEVCRDKGFTIKFTFEVWVKMNVESTITSQIPKDFDKLRFIVDDVILLKHRSANFAVC